jgi:eukaryotic-like serine/threonine-protein kinase
VTIPEELWAEVRAGVEAALAVSPEDRDDFLGRTYPDNHALRTHVAELLDACERAAAPDAAFLAGSASAFAAPLLQGWPGESADAIRSELAGRYEVERELGRGGTATVYLARDIRHGRRVAIKVLAPAVGASLSAERFLHEIRITAGLAHPHILPLHDSGEAAGQLYYVMPYIDGETLRDCIARDGALPMGDVVRILRDVSDALAYAHARDLVHRDIKPANILLADGHALVADFGIARAVQTAFELPAPQQPSLAATLTDDQRYTLTAAGTSPGTPAYMAPEQARGAGGVDHRADLYALGVVAYEALTGAHPFAARSPAAMVAAHLAEIPPPLHDQRPDLPPALASLVAELLAKEPAARPQSANALLRALSSIEMPSHTKRLRRRMLALAALVLMAMGAGGYALKNRTVEGPGAAAPHDAGAIRTLAVLPFENTGGTPGDEYFSDGMTDELAHALTRMPSLRIAGRTSSYAFKGKQVPVPEIGRVLGVQALVTGTIRRAGERLRLATQLVSTADGTVLWDSVFESGTGDVFAVQDELTKSMVAAIAPALRGRVDAMALAERGTADPTAYELYLKGNYSFLLRGPDNIQRAIGSFQQAIARDPNFARAHAGLALAYRLLPIYIALPPDSIVALIETSARRAVALDSTLAAAHVAMANTYELQLRFPEAREAYRAAIALDPASATTHLSFGFNLLDVDPEQALPLLHRALELDPAVKSAAAALPLGYVAARRFGEALDASRHALALDPDFPLAIFVQGQAQVFGGQPDSAVRSQEKGVALYPQDTRLLSNLLVAYAATGRWADAQRIRDRLHAIPDERLLDGTEGARADLVFGDPAPLLRILTSRDGLRRYVLAGGTLGCNPVLDPLWADARFRAAMHRLAIEPCPLVRSWPFFRVTDAAATAR